MSQHVSSKKAGLPGRLLIGVTGAPGSGKTTLAVSVAEHLQRSGVPVGGFVTREVRIQGSRVGFDLIELGSGQTKPFARAGVGEGPRIGRYTVHLENLERTLAVEVDEAIKAGRVVVIDEVGPMELLSEGFRRMVRRILAESSRALLTIHYYSRDPLVGEVRRAVTELVTVRRGAPLSEAERLASLLAGA